MAPKEIQPPELAALADVAEHPHVANWSLRAALTRYAQPQPMRVSKLLEEVRRLEGALGAFTAALRRHGPEVWTALQAGDDTVAGIGDDDGALLLGLLRTAVEVDRLSDALAEWAVDRAGERPDELVDAVTADVAQRLDALGVAREERVPPPGARRRG